MRSYLVGGWDGENTADSGCGKLGCFLSNVAIGTIFFRCVVTKRTRCFMAYLLIDVLQTTTEDRDRSDNGSSHLNTLLPCFTKHSNCVHTFLPTQTTNSHLNKPLPSPVAHSDLDTIDFFRYFIPPRCDGERQCSYDCFIYCLDTSVRLAVPRARGAVMSFLREFSPHRFLVKSGTNLSIHLRPALQVGEQTFCYEQRGKWSSTSSRANRWIGCNCKAI